MFSLALDLVNPFKTRSSSTPAETENVHPTDQLSSPDENGIINGLVLSGHCLPQDHVEDILIHLDPDTLKMARFVCKSWRQMIENYVFKKKAVEETVYSFSKCSEIQKTEISLPWWMYYAICKFDPFNRNLVKNNCGQEQQEHWTVIQGGFGHQYSGWGVENPPVGCDPIPNHPDFEGRTSCFVTSYTLCKKEQQIKLSDVGLSSKIMDVYQPKIIVSEWYAGRFDCGCHYRLEGSVNNEEGETVKKISRVRAIAQWQGKAWNKVQITLKNYGPSARFIKLFHSGRDLQFWNGHYGSKMSGASVKVCLPLRPACTAPPGSCSEDEDSFEGFPDNDLHLIANAIGFDPE